MRFLVPTFAVLVNLASAQWTDPLDQPQELGAIRWQRDYATVRTDAKALSRPILMLFQEVPG